MTWQRSVRWHGDEAMCPECSVQTDEWDQKEFECENPTYDRVGTHANSVSKLKRLDAITIGNCAAERFGLASTIAVSVVRNSSRRQCSVTKAWIQFSTFAGRLEIVTGESMSVAGCIFTLI